MLLVPSVDTSHSSALKGIVSNPCIYIMDCGCWTGEEQYFGALSGSYLVVGVLRTHPDKKIPYVDFPLAEIKNDLLQKLFEKSAAYVLKDGWAKVVPVRSDEEPFKEELLARENELYLFIPDTHLGLRDQADDFARNPGLVGPWDFRERPPGDPDENLVDLASFLEVARSLKSAKTTIIQLGDLYDIWEAEAEQHIYYEARSSVVRDRHARASLAAKRILESWKKGALRPRFESVIQSIDHYLPGNHDTEVRWLSGEIRANYYESMAGGDEVIEGGQKFIKKGTPGRDHPVSKWEAEHGHAYDSMNSTSATNSIGEVLCKVSGKSIVYAWARRERGVPEPYFMRDECDADWHQEPARLSPSWLSERAEIWNFDEMRNTLAYRLHARMSGDEANSGYKLTPWTSPGGLAGPAVSGIYWGPRQRGQDLPPPRLPLRALVHGHTHTPSLRILKVSPYPPCGNVG